MLVSVRPQVTRRVPHTFLACCSRSGPSSASLHLSCALCKFCLELWLPYQWHTENTTVARSHERVQHAVCLVVLMQEPAALQALIADATARLVELAEAGSSNQAAVDRGAGPGPESSRSASASTQLLAPAAAAAIASPSHPRSKAGGAPTTKQRHAIDDLEEGAFEGSVDAMDGFLDDLGEDSD